MPIVPDSALKDKTLITNKKKDVELIVLLRSTLRGLRIA